MSEIDREDVTGLPPFALLIAAFVLPIFIFRLLPALICAVALLWVVGFTILRDAKDERRLGTEQIVFAASTLYAIGAIAVPALRFPNADSRLLVLVQHALLFAIVGPRLPAGRQRSCFGAVVAAVAAELFAWLLIEPLGLEEIRQTLPDHRLVGIYFLFFSPLMFVWLVLRGWRERWDLISKLWAASCVGQYAIGLIEISFQSRQILVRHMGGVLGLSFLAYSLWIIVARAVRRSET